jgi:hypothetical protein
MPVHRAIFLLFTATISMLLSTSSVFAEPVQQASTCPVASDEVVSTGLGMPARLSHPVFGVSVNGSDIECLFSAGGQMVLVRRSGEYFSGGEAGAATPEHIDELRQMVIDQVDYEPVAGVGDAALWATVRDRGLAPQRMGVLISKQGVDAFAIGVMDTPEALDMATTLTRAVLAAQVP